MARLGREVACGPVDDELSWTRGSEDPSTPLDPFRTSRLSNGFSLRQRKIDAHVHPGTISQYVVWESSFLDSCPYRMTDDRRCQTNDVMLRQGAKAGLMKPARLSKQARLFHWHSAAWRMVDDTLWYDEAEAVAFRTLYMQRSVTPSAFPSNRGWLSKPT